MRTRAGFDSVSIAVAVLRTAMSAVVLVVLAGCGSLVQSLKNEECRLAEGEPYDVVAIDLERHALRLVWKDASGEPFRTLNAVREWVEAQGDSVVAITNAGIYEPGLVPTGLYVQEGRELHPLNLSDGEGNFYLRPNGVFAVTAEGAVVVESASYPAIADAVEYATQSGPLLVYDGTIHPAFTAGSENCRLRSGIGVADDGHVYLAVSNGAVNFYDFARFFRDGLGADDALYLDGGISELYAPSIGRTATGEQAYAAILVVTARAETPGP